MRQTSALIPYAKNSRTQRPRAAVVAVQRFMGRAGGRLPA
jgi:hypothetical protein